MIATWFADDLTLPRPDARAHHKITAIGSSSLSKAEAFAKKHLPNTTPKCYANYESVYNDPDVDIVYIATPHAFHLENSLAAISAGKHVLIEKPMAMNAKQAKQILAAAKEKGVFAMEGMWTRFFPLAKKVQELLHVEKVIGDVQRTFCDFGLDMPLASLPASSRLKDPKLGAGSLLDIGIYSLTWGILTLEDGKSQKVMPKVQAVQTLADGIDVASSVLLFYPESGKQGILTSSTLAKTGVDFCRVEGSGGHLIISGPGASMPDKITVVRKKEGGQDMGDKKEMVEDEELKEVFNFEEISGGKGFYYEADAIAHYIAQGKLESDIIPLQESLRLLEIMDNVRSQGGARFPQDEAK